MSDLPEPIRALLRAANTEVIQARARVQELESENARLRTRVQDLEPAAAISVRLLDRTMDELDGLIARKDEGNPYHDDKGHFTNPGGVGHAHPKPHGKHHAKRQRRKERQKRKPRKPGEKTAASHREKAKPVWGEMKAARREGKGKDARIIMADGSPAPAHVPAGIVSPKGTDVKVSVDPKAEVLATWRDEKGRPKQVTTKSYDARSAAVKFGRVSEMIGEHAAISKGIQEGRKGPHKEEADAAWLMQVQATRPGSNTDTKADVKAYGATTLEARHVVQSKDGVRLQFVGKEGLDHDHLVRDPELAKMLMERKKAAGSPNGKLFKTDEKKTGAFVKTLGSGGFTPKDFRTSAATRMARDLVAAEPEPSRSAKEHRIRVNAVAVKVSKLLGNEPKMALTRYIHPIVFAPWERK